MNLLDLSSIAYNATKNTNLGAIAGKFGDITDGFNITKGIGSGVPFVQRSNSPNTGAVPERESVPTRNVGGDGSTQNTGAATNTGPATSGGGGGGAAVEDYSHELATLDSQERMLRDFLGRASGRLDQGLSQLGNEYNREVSGANMGRSRALEDFDTKTTQTTQGKQDALGRVDQNANVLANSLRQRIGRASGSGSSAYQIAAPGAVAREASQDRGDVLESFGQNFAALDTGKKRADEDYGQLLTDLADQKNLKESGLRRGVTESIQDAEGRMGDIARQRAAYQGRDINGIKAAGAPFDAAVTSRNSQLDSLFNQFNTPYAVKPVNVQAPNLRDYVTGQTQVTQQQQQAGQSGSPYGPFLQPQDEEEKNRLF